MAIPRFLYPNYVRTGNTTVSVSSERSTHPRHWLQDPLRSKAWRSATGWTIVAGFNDEILFRTDDGNRLGHIAPGTYATGSAMATAVATALTNAGYNPLSGLSATGWWRADSVTLDSDGKVSQLTDLSGNNRHLTQSTASLRPTWIASALDSRPGLYFNNTASMKLSSTATMSQLLGASGVGTVVMVFRLDSDATPGDTLFFAGGGAQFMVMEWQSGTNFRNFAFDTASRSVTKAAGVGVGGLHHGWWRYDLANLQCYIDDADDAAAASSAMTGAQHANLLAGNFHLGCDAGSPLKGYIMECLTFSSALDQTSRRGLTMYLKQRYPSLVSSDSTTAVGFGSVTASYSSTTKQFTLANTAGGATIFQLLAATGVPAENRLASCFLDLGFTLTDKTGALTYTGSNTSYQSRHWLKIDIGASPSITAGAVLDHNAGTGGTFTLEGNATDLWLAPSVSQVLAGDATLRIAFFNATSQRHWRLLINDVSNSAGYAEVGVWSVSPYVAPSVCHTDGFQKTPEELSPIGYGTHGSHFADERPQRWVWSLLWDDVPDADRLLFQTLVTTLKAGQTFFVAWDPVTTPTDTFYVFRRDAVTFAMATARPYWDIPIILAEALD